MRRLLSVLVASAVFSFGLLASTAGDARADDAHPASAAAAPAAAATPAEKPQADDDSPEIKRLSLELNPLGLAIGRYSIQGEYMLARHHAVTLNPFYAHAPVTVTVNGKDIDAGSLNGFGGELGYRFYTGSKGANGFFVGPSVIFGSYSQSGGVTAPGAASTDSSFTSIGGAVDVGGQFIIGPGVVLGFGGGLQYTKTSQDNGDTSNLNLASAIIAGGGVRPRALLAVGYSF
jgi:hypothetical protein